VSVSGEHLPGSWVERYPTVEVPATKTQRRQILSGLINEYAQAA